MTLCIAGPGLHAGADVQVDLNRGLPDTGVVWRVGENTKIFMQGGLGAAHSLDAPRTTLIHHENQILRTPEHLLAALLAWPNGNLQIRVLQSELPICDGSALPWVEAIQKILGKQQHLQFYACPLESKHNYSHGFWEVEPSSGNFLEIDLSIDQHGYQDRISLRIQEPKDLFALWESRTFIFESDFRLALSLGLLSGAKEGCGLVVSAPNGKIQVIHGGKLRNPHELAFHKALDLLGDLALLHLQLPKLKIRIHNGGHQAHHHLIQRIQSLCP